MSSGDWAYDIKMMHKKFGFHQVLADLPANLFPEFMAWREQFLAEEMEELRLASSPEDKVDALIDLCVIAIGTLDLFGVDALAAWQKVMNANMQKQPGRNAKRPGSFGIPDLIKPDGWEPPDHQGNTGTFHIALGTRS